MPVSLTDNDQAILEELAVAEVHDLEQMKALFGKGHATYTKERLLRLRKAGYINVAHYGDNRHGRIGSPHIYYLAKRAVDQLALDPEARRRVLTRMRKTPDLIGATLRHNVLRSKFRTCLVLAERRGELRLNRWIQRKGLGLFGENAGGEQHEIEPDAVFTLGGERHFFLEVDGVSYPVRRAEGSRWTSVEKKLRLYESLFERDSSGRRWRLAPLEMSMFRLIFLKRASRTRNGELREQRFQSIRELFADGEFPQLRKVVRFLDEDSLTYDRLPVFEDVDGKERTIFDEEAGDAESTYVQAGSGGQGREGGEDDQGVRETRHVPGVLR